jgi:alcohol dehydrogenase (cytochrome c)
MKSVALLEGRGLTSPAILVACSLFACGTLPPAGREGGAVTSQRLVAAAEDSPNWLTYSGTYDGKRHSALVEIDRQSVRGLQLKWVHGWDPPHPVETTPLVVAGVMYATRPPNDVLAIDARTGTILWELPWSLPGDMPRLCCGRVNRGLAILGETLYLATLDAHLVAIDSRTGAKKWDVEVADHALGFNMTSAPLAVKDMIIVGTSLGSVDGEAEAQLEAIGVPGNQMRRAWKGEMTADELRAFFDVLYDKRIEALEGMGDRRGHVDAYDAETGALRWRFHTVPGPGEPGNESWEGESWRMGAASPWMTGSYDPESNLLYWGAGNPKPALIDFLRKGDNLYSSSMLALDADTGELKWHFQFTPHDRFDWDAAQVPVLVDMELGGSPRKLLLTANRNAFFYSLDRQTGELLGAWPFARQTWSEGRDESGRPVFKPGVEARIGGAKVSPNGGGGTSWYSPSFSPQTGLFYVTAHDATGDFNLARLEDPNLFEPDLTSWVRAIDPGSGKIVWEFRLPGRSTSGILTTASGLLFVGSIEGDFWALDASSGENLWHERVEGWIHSAGITYESSGRQLVSIASSAGIFTFGLEPSADVH